MELRAPSLEVHAGYLLVQPLGTTEVTATGAIRPEQYEDKAYKGVVVSANPNDKGLMGKTVYFSRFAHFPLNVGSETLLVLQEADIIAHER